MKHESPHSLGESPSSGGMTTEIETTPIEIRDNAYWPDESLLADFAGMDVREEQTDRPLENNPEYAELYFVS